MSVRKKEDLIVGKEYYLSIVEGEQYADAVKLERIEQPKALHSIFKIKQTLIHVVDGKKKRLVLDIRQVGIGETKKEATRNFLML